jgi:hypothetical protein
MWLEESNQYGQTPTNWVSHPSGIGYRRSSPGITTWSGSGSGSTSSTGAAIPGNPVTMDTGMSDGGNQDEINRLNNFITGGNENPTAMQPGPISRGEQEGGGGPLRSNLGNEMNVGGYVGYGLLQQFGLIPEQSDRSSGDPNHVDSSRSGTGGRNYGDGGSYSPPVESAPPGEPGPASTAGSQPPVGQRISPVAGEDPGATTEPLPGLYEGYAYEVGKTAKGEARAYSAFHRLPP